MAKELPYFQFEPAEYLTKDISFCSLAAQGLFINICSYYWQRECIITNKQILRRFNYPDLLEELIEENVLTVDGENIIINFLYEQYYDIMKSKEDSSEKGKIGNLKRWHRAIYDDYIANKISLDEAIAISKLSGGDKLAITKTSQIREEKIIEDKNKEDKTKPFNFLNALLDLGIEKQIAKDWIAVRKNKNATNTETAFNGLKNKIDKSDLTPNECAILAVENSWSGFDASWIKPKPKKKSFLEENNMAF